MNLKPIREALENCKIIFFAEGIDDLDKVSEALEHLETIERDYVLVPRATKNNIDIQEALDWVEEQIDHLNEECLVYGTSKKGVHYKRLTTIDRALRQAAESCEDNNPQYHARAKREERAFLKYHNRQAVEGSE